MMRSIDRDLKMKQRDSRNFQGVDENGKAASPTWLVETSHWSDL